VQWQALCGARVRSPPCGPREAREAPSWLTAAPRPNSRCCSMLGVVARCFQIGSNPLATDSFRTRRSAAGVVAGARGARARARHGHSRVREASWLPAAASSTLPEAKSSWSHSLTHRARPAQAERRGSVGRHSGHVRPHAGRSPRCLTNNSRVPRCRGGPLSPRGGPVSGAAAAPACAEAVAEAVASTATPPSRGSTHNLFVAVTHNLFVVVTHNLFVAVTHNLFVAVTHNLFVAVTHNLFVAVSAAARVREEVPRAGTRGAREVDVAGAEGPPKRECSGDLDNSGLFG